MVKEIHIYLDNWPVNQNIYTTYLSTKYAYDNGEEIILTTQLEFLDLFMAERLFVHYKNIEHEIKVGGGDENDCCQQVRQYNNLVRMLRAGCFNWYQEG